ncbi:MAG: hypothetical protein H7195_09445, partial [Chryseobacterium sp.]|nr:hypothetical protein [Chryseobacterium sp.]
VTGIAGGLISAVGCLIGGFICDRMKPQNAYVIFGLLGAITAVGMAYCPRTEIMFILWTSIYAVVVGLSYAGSTAFILEAIGKGAAATKYNIFAALSNAPLYLMTYVIGVAYVYKGGGFMLVTEAEFGVGAIIIFFLIKKFVLNRKSVSVVQNMETN